jgi:hypothetical protein
MKKLIALSVGITLALTVSFAFWPGPTALVLIGSMMMGTIGFIIFFGLFMLREHLETRRREREYFRRHPPEPRYSDLRFRP